MPATLNLTTPDGTLAQVLTLPTKWADVSLEQFVALYAAAPDATHRAAEVLCGLEAGGLDNLAADDVKYLATLLGFAADPSSVLELLPTPNLPDIGSLPYGTLLLAQQYLEANPERPWVFYGPYLLALYRVQLAFGKYDAGKVAACEAALLAAPVTESYADAAFFLSSYRAWLSDTPPTKPTTATQTTKNLTPVSKGSRKGSGRFSAWMRSRAAPS
jgi:hypothetical protein